jgi:hypothetical protein
VSPQYSVRAPLALHVHVANSHYRKLRTRFVRLSTSLTNTIDVVLQTSTSTTHMSSSAYGTLPGRKNSTGYDH